MFSQSQIKEVFKDYKIRPARRLGQNFLIDKNINQKIIEEIGLTKEDIIIEIGAGFGNLTGSMASKADKVYAIEIDKRLVDFLKEKFSPLKNVVIVEGDFLKINLDEFITGEDNKKFKIVGNLPYYIGSPIIFEILKYRKRLKSSVIMMQKEVARRLTAKTCSKDYGILSCLVNFYAESRLLRYIAKDSFYPRPKVDSALVSLDFFKKPLVELKDEKMFFKVIKGAFSKRRKQVFNALSSYKILNLNKEALLPLLEKLKISPKKRAEEIEIKDFAKLANLISSIKVEDVKLN